MSLSSTANSLQSQVLTDDSTNERKENLPLNTERKETSSFYRDNNRQVQDSLEHLENNTQKYVMGKETKHVHAPAVPI